MSMQPDLPKPKNMTEWGDLLEKCIANTKTMAPDASATLMDQVIAACPDGRGRGINAALEAQVKALEERLPAHLKGEAGRFIKVAMLTFQKRPELQECTPASFQRCVMDAAQYGFAIDGRLFHAVARNRKMPDGSWVKEAQCMPDYKGLIAVCKRAGAITDCEARIVGPKDQFELWFEGGATHLVHKPDFKNPVGEADLMKTFQGIYVRLWLPHAPGWVVEYMSAEEIRKVAGCSDAGKKGFGPWKDWFFEMGKKTVLKRSTKTRVDDPAYSQLLELDDREYERTPDPDAPLPTGTPVVATPGNPYAALTESLAPVPGEPESFDQGTEPASTITESAPPQSIDDAGEEPDLSEGPGPNADEANLDNLRNSLTGCSARWEVEDVANGYKDVFISESAKVQGRNIVKAAYARCTPEAAPAKSKGKQKQAFPTNSGTGV